MTKRQDEYREAISTYGGVRAAARALGVSHTSIMRSLSAASAQRPAPTVEVAPAPDPNEPIEDLIARKKARYARTQASEGYHRLVPVRVLHEGPVAVCPIGDPHVDDDGCDIDALERDMTIIGRTPGMHALHVGDVTNNWVGRLGRLYAHQSTTAADAIRLVEWMFGLAKPLAVVGGNHDCHDDQTEALTRRGWVRGPDILDADEVLTLNMKTGHAEWNPVQARIDRPHEGEMVRIKSLSVDALVTPNHRVLHRSRKRPGGVYSFNADLEYASADSLPSRFAVPVSAVEVAPGCGLTDDQIRFAGWALTDGGISNGRVSIYQSKDGAEIERVLAAVGVEYTMTTRNRAITAVCGRALVKPPLPQREYRLNAASSRKALVWVPEKGRLPAWADATTARQFDVLLDALVAGDGTWDGADPAGKTCAVLHGTREFLEHVQALAVRRGWYARVSVARQKDYRLNLSRRTELQMERNVTVSREHYSGRVWCLTVANSNFLVRRNGAAHFSGNCWNEGMSWLNYCVRQAGCELVQPHGVRIELQFPAGDPIRVHTRHDFPGHSQYNPVHGLRKEHLFGLRDHVNIAGHKHIDSYSVVPSPDGYMQHMLRVSGYKAHDDYAKAGNFQPMKMAPACALVINPTAACPAETIKPFWDLAEAADFLAFKRRRARTA